MVEKAVPRRGVPRRRSNPWENKNWQRRRISESQNMQTEGTRIKLQIHGEIPG